MDTVKELRGLLEKVSTYPWINEGTGVWALYNPPGEWTYKDGKATPTPVNWLSLSVQWQQGGKADGTRFGCSQQEAEDAATLICTLHNKAEALIGCAEQLELAVDHYENYVLIAGKSKAGAWVNSARDAVAKLRGTP